MGSQLGEGRRDPLHRWPKPLPSQVAGDLAWGGGSNSTKGGGETALSFPSLGLKVALPLGRLPCPPPPREGGTHRSPRQAEQLLPHGREGRALLLLTRGAGGRRLAGRKPGFVQAAERIWTSHQPHQQRRGNKAETGCPTEALSANCGQDAQVAEREGGKGWLAASPSLAPGGRGRGGMPRLSTPGEQQPKGSARMLLHPQPQNRLPGALNPTQDPFQEQVASGHCQLLAMAAPHLGPEGAFYLYLYIYFVWYFVWYGIVQVVLDLQ